MVGTGDVNDASLQCLNTLRVRLFVEVDESFILRVAQSTIGAATPSKETPIGRYQRVVDATTDGLRNLYVIW